jgi:hypothetical protein
MLFEAGRSKRVAAENDYRLRGRILSWRELKNEHTTSDLIWIKLDLERLTLEILVNRSDLNGILEIGGWLSAEIWLQGYMLNEKQLEARFEGIDPRVPRQQFWRQLSRRGRMEGGR